MKPIENSRVEELVTQFLWEAGTKVPMAKLRSKFDRQVSGEQMDAVVHGMVRCGRLRSAGRAGVYLPVMPGDVPKGVKR